MAPKPPAFGAPGEAVALLFSLSPTHWTHGGPRDGPQTPLRSERPGEAVALLDTRQPPRLMPDVAPSLTRSTGLGPAEARLDVPRRSSIRPERGHGRTRRAASGA